MIPFSLPSFASSSECHELDNADGHRVHVSVFGLGEGLCRVGQGEVDSFRAYLISQYHLLVVPDGKNPLRDLYVCNE